MPDLRLAAVGAGGTTKPSIAKGLSNMTRGKKFKKGVRAKAAAGGLSYSAARKVLAGRREPQVREGSGVDRFMENRRAFRDESLASWRDVTSAFGTHGQWSDLVQIVTTLEHVARNAVSNHTHFPDGGGFDLSGAMLAPEPGCVRLTFQADAVHVIARPHRLTMETFERDPLGEWTYFRLDLAALVPTGLSEGAQEYGKEPLVELASGGYRNPGGSDDDPIPRGARRINRYLSGAFLIIPKTCLYNAMSSTYDGRHSRMAAADFRSYIERSIAALHGAGKYGVDIRTGIRHWNP